MIEFISYTGKYPNLCSGVFTVKIDGKTVGFGHDSSSYNWRTSKYNDSNYEAFWTTGGNCGFRNNYEESYINREPWQLTYETNCYPNHIKDLLPELLRVFNENVPYGCCGGCL